MAKNNNIQKFVIAGAGAALLDGLLLSPLLSRFGLTGANDDVVRIISGLVVTNFFKGANVRQIGQALTIVGAFGVGRSIAQGTGLGGLIGGGAQPTVEQNLVVG